MLGATFSAVGLTAGDLEPGGKFHDRVLLNQARVKNLAATESGRASFCRNIRSELSAMFD